MTEKSEEEKKEEPLVLETQDQFHSGPVFKIPGGMLVKTRAGWRIYYDKRKRKSDQ